MDVANRACLFNHYFQENVLGLGLFLYYEVIIGNQLEHVSMYVSYQVNELDGFCLVETVNTAQRVQSSQPTNQWNLNKGKIKTLVYGE